MQRITWNGIALHAARCPDMRLRTAACGCPTLCGEAVRQDVDRDAGDHFAERRGPVEFSHPALFVPNAEAVAAAPARAETLAREAAEAAKTAEEAKKAAVTTARETAMLTASLRKWNGSRPALTPSSRSPQGARRRKDGPGQSAG